MREPRNPFRLRASEHIESDATFLRLFEPAMPESPQPGNGPSCVVDDTAPDMKDEGPIHQLEPAL